MPNPPNKRKTVLQIPPQKLFISFLKEMGGYGKLLSKITTGPRRVCGNPAGCAAQLNLQDQKFSKFKSKPGRVRENPPEYAAEHLDLQWKPGRVSRNPPGFRDVVQITVMLTRPGMWKPTRVRVATFSSKWHLQILLSAKCKPGRVCGNPPGYETWSAQK